MQTLIDQLNAADLGPVEAVVPLKGALDLEGGPARAALARGAWGLWLLAVDAEGALVAADLIAPERIRIEPGTLHDTITIGAARLSIPVTRRRALRSLLALARLGPPRAGAAAREILDAGGGFFDADGEAERAWLLATLEADEIPLAWMKSGVEAPVPSAILEGAGAQRILITDARAERVTVGEVGDVDRAPMGDDPAGDARGRLGALSAALGQVGGARILEVARVGWRRGDARTSRVLLERIRDDPWAQLALGAALADVALPAAPSSDAALPDAALATPLEALSARPAASAALAAWVEAWGLPLPRAEAILGWLLARGAHAWAAPLGAWVHRRRGAALKPADVAALAALDLTYARHLIDAGAPERAARLLDARLEAMPGERLEELLPDEGAEARALRVQLAEVAAEARPGAPGPLRRLARLEPLSLERHAALVRVEAGGSLGGRAALALEALSPGGLGATPTTTAPLRALDEALLEDAVRHPEARSDGALGKLQSLLAAADLPDPGALRAWCQRLAPSAGPTALGAHEALLDASWALGLEGVEGYISQGEKTIGVRAWEGRPSLLVIGGDHLAPGGPAALGPRELRFAIGAELAHVRFKHSRVTWQDVQAGAWEAGVAGLDLAVTLLPALKGVRLVDRLTAWHEGALGGALAKIDVAGRAWSRIGDWLPGRADGNALEIRNEELVAAHRVVQLTADRAGLALCGDLRAAIRAMMLTRVDLAAELPLAVRHGLPALLGRREDDPRRRDLSLRLGALIAFWLSPDYERIRAGLRRGEGEA